MFVITVAQVVSLSLAALGGLTSPQQSSGSGGSLAVTALPIGTLHVNLLYFYVSHSVYKCRFLYKGF